MSCNLVHPLAEFARSTPDSLALFADGEEIGYGELARWASAIAAVFRRRQRAGRRGSACSPAAARPPMPASSASGGRARLMPRSGLNWPDARLAAVLAQMRLDALILDASGAGRLGPRCAPPARS